MASPMLICNLLSMLTHGWSLCDGVYSASCYCVQQQFDGPMNVCCAGVSGTADVSTLLNEELPHQARINSLEISWTEWDEFPAHLFTSARLQVRLLSLAHNGISELPENAFAGLQGTQGLFLRHNQLTEVPTAALQQLPHLHTLEINSNRISRLLAGQLDPLFQLSHFSLAENRLNLMEPGSLPTGLVHLSLNGNQLTTMNGAVRRLKRLQWLFVSANRLTSLDGQLPLNGELSLLTAGHNQLTSLAGLQDADRLERVYVQYNQIRTVSALSLPRLTVLDLAGNNISQISGEDFAGVPSLRQLLLAENQLTELGHVLDALPALFKLDLSGNRLTSLTSLSSSHNQENNGEKGLGSSLSLRWLNLRYNELTSIGPLWLPKLKVLDLSDNRLAEIHGADYDGLPALKELNLSGNMISDVGLLLEALPSLTKADLSGNILDSIAQLTNREQLPHNKPKLAHLETLILNNNSLNTLHVSLHRLPALCVLDVRHNNIETFVWQDHRSWKCAHTRGTLKLNGNPVHCEDIGVRSSLESAVPHFTLDISHCNDVRVP